MYRSLSEMCPPPISLQVIAKDPKVHPPNIICSSMQMMKSVVYVWAYYTLYCVCVITSRCTRAAAAAEVDAVGVQFSLTM